MYLLGIQQWIWEAINSIWFMLCDWIYSFISFMYQVFMKIASVNLFSTEIFKEITGRIYVVMGIAMLFIFAYNLVLMIINPEDKKGTGAMGKVVKETIISLVVVVLLPTIFNYMYIFQNHILESNVIGQIIMGGGINTGGRDPSNCNPDDFACKCDYTTSLPYLNVNDPMEIVLSSLYNTNTPLTTMSQKLDAVCETYRGYKPLSNGKYITDSDRGAYSIAPLIFSSFYRPHFFSMEQCEDYLKTGNTSVLTMDKSQALCQRYYFHYYASVYTGDFGYFSADEITRDFIADPNDEHMEFNWPLAIVAGIMGLWMFICYTMEIGVRVAKLGVLQIISPIAVMMRIIPGQKEKIFDKWFKNLKDTYIDVFIRLAIIFFSLFAITLVPAVLNALWLSNANGSGSSNPVGDFLIKSLSMVVIILGILKFAQEAPNLIKEFFGDTGRFSFKSPKKQIQDNKVLQGGISKAKGLAGGAASFITTKANQLRNFKGNWNRDDATNGSRARQIKDLASFSSFKKGYDSTKDVKSLDDWGYNVKKSAVDTLKDRGAVYRAKQSLTEIKDDLGTVMGKNYFSQDTKALEKHSEAMDLIAKEAKIIISKLEDDAKFKGVVAAFDSAIETANRNNRPDLVSKITENKVKALADMRNALLKEKLEGKEAKVKYELDTEGATKAIVENMTKATKGISREITAAIENLNSALGDNFERFSEGIQDSTKELGITFGDNMIKNRENLQNSISEGNAKLIKNIKTVSEDMSAAAKAEIIKMENKTDKK